MNVHVSCMSNDSLSLSSWEYKQPFVGMGEKTMIEKKEIPNPKQIGIPSPYQKSFVLVVRLKLSVISSFMLTFPTL